MKRVAVSSSTWVNSSSNWSITSSSWPWSSGRTRWTARRTPPGARSRSSSAVGASVATRTRAASSSSNGCGAGVISMRNQSADIGRAPLRQRRQQPGAHDARLAAPARPDDGDEASPGAGLAEAGDEPLDEAFPPEEVPGVGGAERPQPLVRVLDRGVVEQRRRRGAERVGQAPGRTSPRPSTAGPDRSAVARSSTVRTAGGSAPRTCSYSPVSPVSAVAATTARL